MPNIRFEGSSNTIESMKLPAVNHILANPRWLPQEGRQFIQMISDVKEIKIILDYSPGSHLKSMILLVGCFHTFNLLGAIDPLMEGSWLKGFLLVVSGENVVGHMMTGTSIRGAFRDNLLVDKCLNSMMVSIMANASLEFTSETFGRIKEKPKNGKMDIILCARFKRWVSLTSTTQTYP